jgi:hypothetical protein
MLGSLTFILANVGPSRLDTGDASLIDGVSVSLTQLEQCFTGDASAIERLRLDPLEDFGAQVFHLRNEFWPHIIILQVLQFLEIFLIFCGPDHRIAVSILEERDNHASDPVFILYGVGCAALLP